MHFITFSLNRNPKKMNLTFKFNEEQLFEIEKKQYLMCSICSTYSLRCFVIIIYIVIIII